MDDVREALSQMDGFLDDLKRLQDQWDPHSYERWRSRVFEFLQGVIGIDVAIQFDGAVPQQVARRIRVIHDPQRLIQRGTAYLMNLRGEIERGRVDLWPRSRRR